jgi:predicted GNAT superfamily acetyltransferase
MAPDDRVRRGDDGPRSGDVTSRTDRDAARVADDAAGAADDAARVAVEAARAAGVEVGDLDGPAAMREAAEVFDRTWGRGGQRGSVLPTEALVALAHAGAQVSGARRDGTLVGATAAFLGRTADGRPLLHSHVTAVVPGGEGRAVGRALKWHQRAWCLARDIEQVRWTFDPLIRRNAVFNLIVLGAHATGFEHDVYGPMDDDRNAGVPTDRLRVVWDLLAPRVRSAAAGRAAAPDASALLRAGAIVTLEEGPHGPEARDTNAPRRLVRAPADIEALRRDRPAVADAWTQAYRDVLGATLGSGFRITGATRDGWYVLSADRGVDELAARP